MRFYKNWHKDVQPRIAMGTPRAWGNVYKVLEKLLKKNNEFKKLTIKDLKNIFDDAEEKAEYSSTKFNYTNDAIKHKFSAAFQKECKTQGIYFSSTSSNGNSNGMRTKSVNKFLKDSACDIEDILIMFRR